MSSEQVVGFHQLADDSPEISSLISPKSRKDKKIVILVAAMIEVYLLACWVIFHVLLSADFFKINFFKNSFRNTFRMSNSLDPDQDRHSVGPDLGPNRLQRLSADDKSWC